MPRVPIYDRQLVPLGPVHLPRMDTSYRPSGLEFVGAGLGNLAETFQKTQYAAEVAEGGRLVRETSAEMQAAIKQAAMDYADPKTFEEEAKYQIHKIRQNRLESASSGRVRRHLEDSMGDDLITRQADIQSLKFGKMRTIAKGNWVIQKEDSIQQYAAAENNPVERSKIASELGSTLRDLAASNLLDADDKARELESITETMGEIDIRRDFKNEPIKTLEAIDAGAYARKIRPNRLEEIKHNLATSYRVAQAAVKQQVKDEQDDNFADAMVRARRPGGLTQLEIDAMSVVGPDGKRRIDAQQAIHLTNQLRATAASGGVLYSNPDVLSDLQFRLHRGKVGFEEIRSQQIGQQLTTGDANELYAGLEGRIRRDRAEAREIESLNRQRAADERQKRADEKALDVSNDLNYKRAARYIEAALPNADRLDLDHSFRIMVGQAFVDFDDAARAKNPDGTPKYRPVDLQKLAENVVEGTLYKMDLAQNSARSKLKPGIKTPEDVAEAVRKGRLSPTDAREQMRYLMTLGPQINTAPSSPVPQLAPKPTESRDEAARRRAKESGAP